MKTKARPLGRFADDDGRRPDPREVRENQEQKIIRSTLPVRRDKEEGLILVLAATLLDGNPRNNVLERTVTFNPGGILKGADYVKVAGPVRLVGCDKGLVVVDVNDPAKPVVAGVYEGMQDVARRRGPVPLDLRRLRPWVDLRGHHAGAGRQLQEEPDARVADPLRDARGLYVAKTYAYVAAGRDWIVIVDITKPDAMSKVQRFTADGRIRDANEHSAGHHQRVALRLCGRRPQRVARRPAHRSGTQSDAVRLEPEAGPAAHRDGPHPGQRAFVEPRPRPRPGGGRGGHQLAVFNRVGARPFTFAEMQRFYRLPGGSVFTGPRDPECR